MSTSAVDADNVGDYPISARSFEEYRAMFALANSHLAGGILDCHRWWLQLHAGANELGASAVAADPVYRLAPEYLGQLVMKESRRGSAHAEAGADRYDWDFYGGIEGHATVRLASAETFATDIAAHPERYIAASLPNLPFRDRWFDLVLSSHFLFSYADRLDTTFHLAALHELHRVTPGEVRIFPLLQQGTGAKPKLLEEVLGQLEVPHRVCEVDYEFQRGGNQMLVLGRTIA